MADGSRQSPEHASTAAVTSPANASGTTAVPGVCAVGVGGTGCHTASSWGVVDVDAGHVDGETATRTVAIGESDSGRRLWGSAECRERWCAMHMITYHVTTMRLPYAGTIFT